MWSVKYYTRPNGHKPLTEWRDSQPKELRADVDARIRRLREEGIETLIYTKMLDRIAGSDKDLYELRGVALKWRIAFYFDRPLNTFVLLHGWRKQKAKHKRDIDQARRFLHEYLASRGRQDG